MKKSHLGAPLETLFEILFWFWGPLESCLPSNRRRAPKVAFYWKMDAKEEAKLEDVLGRLLVYKKHKKTWRKKARVFSPSKARKLEDVLYRLHISQKTANRKNIRNDQNTGKSTHLIGPICWPKDEKKWAEVVFVLVLERFFWSTVRCFDVCCFLDPRLPQNVLFYWSQTHSSLKEGIQKWHQKFDKMGVCLGMFWGLGPALLGFFVFFGGSAEVKKKGKK